MTTMKAVEEDVLLRVFESFDTRLGAVIHLWKQGRQDPPPLRYKPIISRGGQIRLQMAISKVNVRRGADTCARGRTSRPSL